MLCLTTFLRYESSFLYKSRKRATRATGRGIHNPVSPNNIPDSRIDPMTFHPMQLNLITGFHNSPISSQPDRSKLRPFAYEKSGNLFWSSLLFGYTGGWQGFEAPWQESSQCSVRGWLIWICQYHAPRSAWSKMSNDRKFSQYWKPAGEWAIASCLANSSEFGVA